MFTGDLGFVAIVKLHPPAPPNVIKCLKIKGQSRHRAETVCKIIRKRILFKRGVFNQIVHTGPNVNKVVAYFFKLR